MASPVWTADIHIDSSLARSLVRLTFPELCAQSVEPFGVGWDNAAFLVDERVVFRFPRRRIAARLIERECSVLPGIAPHVPLPISTPRFVGSPSQAYPWVFAGYDLISGTTACSTKLGDDERAALAIPIATFLRALHRIDPAPLVGRGLPPDEIGRLDHGKRLRLTEERLPFLAREDLADAIQGGIAWLKAHPPVALDDSARKVVHGDLYARHLVLDNDALLAGVIDWGDVHLGDPAIDIAVAFLMLPASAHAVFAQHYGPINERTWNAARYRATYHAILELDYGVRANDAPMREIGATALRLLAAADREAERG